MTNCTISGNTSQDVGGGIFNSDTQLSRATPCRTLDTQQHNRCGQQRGQRNDIYGFFSRSAIQPYRRRLRQNLTHCLEQPYRHNGPSACNPARTGLSKPTYGGPTQTKALPPLAQL